MKKILFLLVCGFAAALSSCKDDGADDTDFRLFAPEVSQVASTTAAVSCRAAFDLEEYARLRKGFVYGTASQAVEDYALTTVVSVAGDTFSGRLTGLQPETDYRVYAFLDLGGSRVLSGQAAAFRTAAGTGGEDPELEITSQDPMNVAATAGNYEINYLVTNPGAEPAAAADCESAWVHSFDNSEPGRIAFTVDANTSDARTASITLTYPGANPCTLTLTQAAAGEQPLVEPTFGAPSHSGVTAGGASISCSFAYTGDKPISAVYFLYQSTTGAEHRAVVTAQAGVKTASLSGLSASTSYTYRLCVEIAGVTYSSASASFTTGSSQVSGDTKYAGWPELPVEVNNADYHYAYHICPDFKVAGRLARNYTVCYSADNHCPVWVAAPRHACYEVKNSDRTDAYGRDPDIPSNIQYSSEATGGGCNKGHMLGSAERLVTAATNKQVFYYTNIAPQLSGTFNTGGGAWNNLEEFVDRQVCADTTYIVVGTYFEPFTDAYGKSCSPQTISFGGRSDVTRPSMFYYLILRTKSGSTRKSVRDCSADELKCAAFVLRHNMDKGHEPQAKDMMSVADIEQLTGFQFFTNVPNAPKQTYNAGDWGL